MNVSYDWLRAFCPVDVTPSGLRDLLTAHSATVDELVDLRADLQPIVVARVVEARRHPDSDHLWATRVDAGGELLDVICGAPNVSEGKLYPFAPVGTVMPNGVKIERRKIRGITSNGMLCSARELGLGENQEGILELDVDAPAGTPLLRAMPIGDTQLVVDVAANRPDLLSHQGVAREVSAITGVPSRLPDIRDLGPEPGEPTRVVRSGGVTGLTVGVDPNTNTRRYMVAAVKGLRVATSPAWLVQRLASVGVRSINNVVDATNYVLHELGQPVHAFDLAKLQGGAMTVRLAHAGEKLVTLDGSERAMPSSAVMIADGRQAQAIAGIMGGRGSEVTAATTDILVEVASFDPRLTRAARKALGLSTDASYRFERGVDPQLAPLAMGRVVRLITGLAGGRIVEAPLDIGAEPPPLREIDVRHARVTQILGAAVPVDDAIGYLERAGFRTALAGDSAIKVTVPSWRSDVFTEVDLVEEVARFHGYDRFPVEVRPYWPTNTSDDPLWTSAGRVRNAAVALGLLEVRPMPFVSGDDETHARLGNPVSESEPYLRASLLESLSRRAEFNLAHRVADIRLFEIGSAFSPAPDGSGPPLEQMRLGILMMGRRRPAHFTEPQPPAIDEWDAKGVAEALSRVAFPDAAIDLAPAMAAGRLWEIQRDGAPIGTVQRLVLDAPIWAASAYGVEIALGDVATAAPAARGTHSYRDHGQGPRTAVSRFRPLPAMPPAEFDLALLVPIGTPASRVESVIRDAAGDLLERLELFDQYTGTGIDPGHRSLAWRLTFRHPERTLRDKEIEGRRNKILGALQKELHVRQRTA